MCYQNMFRREPDFELKIRILSRSHADFQKVIKVYSELHRSEFRLRVNHRHGLHRR